MSKNICKSLVVEGSAVVVSGSEIFAGLSIARKSMLDRMKKSPHLRAVHLDAYKAVVSMTFGSC